MRSLLCKHYPALARKKRGKKTLNRGKKKKKARRVEADWPGKHTTTSQGGPAWIVA